MQRSTVLLLVWLAASACGRLTSASAPVATREIRLTPPEDSILVLQLAWVQAALRGEAEASVALMADGFRLVAPMGRVGTKRDWVAMIGSGQQRGDSVT